MKLISSYTVSPISIYASGRSMYIEKSWFSWKVIECEGDTIIHTWIDLTWRQAKQGAIKFLRSNVEKDVSIYPGELLLKYLDREKICYVSIF